VTQTLKTLTMKNSLKPMDRTQLNKLISSLTVELDNARFRAEVITRRIEAVQFEIDRPNRTKLKLAHLRCSLMRWQEQLREAHDSITRSFLELAEARAQLPNTPHAPVSMPRRSTDRSMAGLYRMGRVEIKELA